MDSQEDWEGEKVAVIVLVEVTLVPAGVLHSDPGHPQHPGVQGLHPHRDPAGGDEHLHTNEQNEHLTAHESAQLTTDLTAEGESRGIVVVRGVPGPGDCRRVSEKI